jgi:hypothetical protein
MTQFFKTNWIHFLAIAIGLISSSIFFSPQFEGNALKQHDIEQHKGASQEIAKYNEEDRVIGWTNRMFGGMPTTQIGMKHEGNFMSKINTGYIKVFGIPMSMMLMYFIGFYILACCMKINSWIGILSALAFSFLSYDIIILQAGHNSKALAVGWMAPVLGAFFMTYQRNIIWGALLSSLFMAFEMVQNHLQVTYYLLILLFCIGVAAFINALIKKALPRFLRATTAIIVAYSLAALINSSNIILTNDYSKLSIRGGNDIKVEADGQSNASNVTSGLDRDYVVNWSNGIGESFQLMSPYVKGGNSGYIGNSQFAEKVSNMDLTSEELAAANQSFSYWGEQPGVSGPAYVGAITVFLAILGLIFLKGTWKWGIFAATVLTIMLSWGKNYMGLTNFFLDNIPGYNKFRAVTILVVIAELTLPLLAALLLNEFYKNREIFVEKRKLLLGSCSAILILVLAVKFIGVGDYLTSAEKEFFTVEGREKSIFNIKSQVDKIPAEQLAQQYQLDKNNPQQMEQFVNAQLDMQTKPLEVARKVRSEIFNGSLNNTFLLILFSAGLLLASVYTKTVKPMYAIVAIAVLNIGDLVLVSSNYLNSSEEGTGYKYWSPKLETLYPLQSNIANDQILQMEVASNPSLAKVLAEGERLGKAKANDLEASGITKDNIINCVKFNHFDSKTNYRVWEPSSNFNGTDVSMFHKSLGGYHGAKLRNIQNLFDFHLSKGNNAAYNMMNVKYFIQDAGNGQKSVRYNPEACGAAWMIKKINTFETPDEEIRALGSVFEMKNIGTGTFFVNNLLTSLTSVTGSEKLQYLNGKDTVTVPLSNGLTEGMKIYFVADTAGKMDLIPESTLLNDEFKSFNKMVEIVVKSSFEPKTEGMMLNSFAKKLSSKTFSGEGTVKMTSYDPEKIQYKTSSKEKQFVVFSEVYYPNGWTATINGKEVEISKVDYLLRGLEVPSGDNVIELKFVTPKLATLNMVSSLGCVLLFGLIGLAIFMHYRKSKGTEAK